MKNLLLGAAFSIATAFALPAFAQPGQPGTPPGEGGRVEQAPDGARPDHTRGHGHRHGHGRPSPERRLERLTDALDLTPAQVARIRAIFEEAREEHRGIGRGPEQRDAHRALRERTKERMIAVLTPDQRARFDALRAERRARRAGHHSHGCEGR